MCRQDEAIGDVHPIAGSAELEAADASGGESPRAGRQLGGKVGAGREPGTAGNGDRADGAAAGGGGDRKTGYLMISKLAARTFKDTNRCLRGGIELRPRDLRAITSDNGCEFHGYEDVELSNGTLIYCAPPLHSWERGSNENASGLIRQYLPKGICMAHLTQSECDRIADKLNLRPRKRYN